MDPKSSRDLGRKINTVQSIFFKMSICFVISYIHRKISAFFLHTICHLRSIFSFLSLASHFKSFSTEKNITSQQRSYVFQFQTQSNNLSEQIFHKISEWFIFAVMKIFYYLQVQHFCYCCISDTICMVAAFTIFFLHGWKLVTIGTLAICAFSKKILVQEKMPCFPRVTMNTLA